MKLFAEKGIRANGNLLPFDSFKLFRHNESLTPDKKKLDRIISIAEEALNDPIPFLPASVYREYVKNGNRSNYEDIFFRRRQMAYNLALAEHFCAEGRYTEKLMDVVWAIMEESTWVVPAHLYNHPAGKEFGLGPAFGGEYMHGIDLFSATTSACLTAVYYFCKNELDAISPIICKKLLYNIKERLIKPFIHCTYWWMGETGSKVNNWGPWIVSNVLFAVGVTETDSFIRNSVVNKSLIILDNFIKSYAHDGGCDEGPGYWDGAGASLFDCLELLDDLSGGRICVYDEPLIKNIGEYIYKVNIDGKKFVNFADCRPSIEPNAPLIERYGIKCGSEGMVAFAKSLSDESGSFHPDWQVYRSLMDLFTPSREPVSCPLPTASWLSDLKVMTLRESGKSNSGTFLSAKGGHNNEMHNHNDVGNFVIYRDGNPVIIDAGTGMYTSKSFSSRRYEIWYTQSGYHNLPSFCGTDQMQGGSFRSYEEVYSEDIRTLSMELSGAYPTEAKLDSFRRTLSLKGDTVTVTDSYRLKEVGECVFHFMSATEPKLVGEGRIALAEGMTLTYDTALKSEIEGIEQDEMDVMDVWGTDILYRIKFSVSARSGEYTFTFAPEE